MAKVCCDRLLFAHSANFIVLTFVIVSREIFLVRLFCTPLPAPSRAIIPSAPLKLIHTATPDTTKLSCLCCVSFGGMNNFNVSVGLAAMRNKIQGKTNDEMRACN